MDAVIRKNCGVDPSTLSDEEWSGLYADQERLRAGELKDLGIIITNSLTSVINQFYGGGNIDTMDT